jgi:hypothetical protein
MEDNELYINTHIEMKPGQIHSGLVLGEDGDRVTIIQCIREANKKEYIHFTKKRGLSHMVKRGINDPTLKFYLVKVLD